MNYFLAFIIGAFIWQSAGLALAQHRAHPEVPRLFHFAVAICLAMFWPIVVGMAIRRIILGKPKIPKPSLRA